MSHAYRISLVALTVLSACPTAAAAQASCRSDACRSDDNSRGVLEAGMIGSFVLAVGSGIASSALFAGYFSDRAALAAVGPLDGGAPAFRPTYENLANRANALGTAAVVTLSVSGGALLLAMVLALARGRAPSETGVARLAF